MEGLSFSLQRSNCPISIEMDSIVAVKLVQSKEVDRSMYSSIVSEIRYLLSLRESCSTHISRSQNMVSDSLAIIARTKGRTMTWFDSGPLNAVELSSTTSYSLAKKESGGSCNNSFAHFWLRQTTTFLLF